MSLERLGAVVTKGISLEPMAGHAAPRMVHTAAGMLNAIGLQNVGVEDFIERKLLAAEPVGTDLQGDCKCVRAHGERVHRGDRSAERCGGDCGVPRVECILPECACRRNGLLGPMVMHWKSWLSERSE